MIVLSGVAATAAICVIGIMLVLANMEPERYA